MSPRFTKNRIASATGAFTLAVGLAVANAGTASASWYYASILNQTSLRDCYHPITQGPSTNCTFIKYLYRGERVHIVCQAAGQNIAGDWVWDYVVADSGGQGYVADANVSTGYSNWIPGVDRCR